MDADIKQVAYFVLAGLLMVGVALATLWAVWVIVVSIWLFQNDAIRMLAAGAILGAWIDTILWLNFKND